MLIIDCGSHWGNFIHVHTLFDPPAFSATIYYSHQPFSPNPKLILGSTDYYASHFMGPPLAAHFLSPLAYFLLLCLLLILSPLLYNLSSTGQKAVSINYYYSPSM